MKKDEIERIKRLVEEKLNTFSNLEEFTIGKANDCEKRFKTYYLKKGYTAYTILAEGNAEEINSVEKTLIEFFRKHPTLGKTCANINYGGGGSSEATQLYVAAKYILKKDTDLYDDEGWITINDIK